MSKIPNEVREQLNEKISQGYQLAQSNNEVAASEMWLAAWEMVMEAMDKYDIENLEAFDRDFKGKELIYNLASDLELELDKAASADPSYWEKRIKFCSQYIERYGDQSDYNIMNMRRSIAESYYFMGLSAEGERHFRQIIADYPFWSWGWIGYSDMYWLFGLEKDKDSAKAESILLKALEEKELDEHEEVQQRLKELYLELGRKKDAEDIVIERENYIAPSKQKVIQQSPVKVEKIGRNEPCPCGSGKKYKKCCGAN